MSGMGREFKLSSRCRAMCIAPDDDSKESKQQTNKRVMAYHRNVMNNIESQVKWVFRIATTTLLVLTYLVS